MLKIKSNDERLLLVIIAISLILVYVNCRVYYHENEIVQNGADNKFVDATRSEPLFGGDLTKSLFGWRSGLVSRDTNCFQYCLRNRPWYANHPTCFVVGFKNDNICLCNCLPKFFR